MAEQFSFSVVLEPQQGGGFTVLVPALPEVITEGDTEQEALANAEEAIRAVLSYRRDQGLATKEHLIANAGPQRTLRLSYEDTELKLSVRRGNTAFVLCLQSPRSQQKGDEK